LKKTYGYARVSTREQHLDRQLKALMDAGVEERDIITDKVSGKDLEREGYRSLKNHFLRDGDTLIVKSLDRLRIKILDIPTNMVELPEEQDWIFEMINNILIEVLASIAEQERITTKRRQSEGIAIAKEAGKHLGRPMIDFPPNWNQFYSDWKAGTITAVAAMRQLGLKRSTFYRLVKQQEEKHETEE